MTKIFFIGDTHFGKTYPFLKDYELNISKRNLDVIDNCEKIVKRAIQEHANLIIFLGDLYERQTISPTIRRILRERIFIPLFKANISVIILGGNHDSIRYPIRGADIQELASFPNVEVYTEFATKIYEFDGMKLGLLLLPYLHFDVLVDTARKQDIKIAEDQNNYIKAQRIIKTSISQIYEKELKNCDKKVLIGHYYLDGAKIHETYNPLTIYGEFKFNKEMVQRELFDVVIFGHVHLKQTMWNDDRIIIPGSIDRLDMGERDSDKYYTVYEVENNKIEFRKIECRTLLKLEIDIPENEQDLTAYIIKQLPDQKSIQNALCRIIVNVPKDKESRIDKSSIEKYFKDTFYTEFIYAEKAGIELEHLREINLDPTSLFLDYLEQKYAAHPYYEDLKTMGSNILEEKFKSIAIPIEGPLSIKSINIQNFNNYGKGPNKIIFENDSYVIKGPTGAGKSSLLDAVTFALFKRSSRKDAGMNLDEILYEKGYVELELMIGIKALSIKRNKSTPKLQIKLDGKELYKGMNVSDKEKKIEEIIGYDYESFISSFFIRQQELQLFSSLDSGKRQKVLIKLFKLKIFQDAEESLKNVVDELEKLKENLEGQILIHQENVAELPQLKENLKEIKSILERAEQEKTKISVDVKQIKQQVESLTVEATKYAQVKKLLEQLQGDIEKNKQDLIKYHKAQEEFNILQKRIEQFPDMSKEKESLFMSKERINVKLREKERILSEIHSTENLFTAQETQYNSHLTKLKAQLKDKIRRLEDLNIAMTKDEAFNILKEEGKLSERLMRLQDIEIPMAKEYKDQKKVKEFKLLEEKTAQDLREMIPKEELISKDIFIAEEIQKDKQSIDQQYKELEQKKGIDLKKLQDDKEKWNTIFIEQGLSKDFEEQLKDLEEKLILVKKKENEKLNIESQLQKIKDYTLLIERIKKDLIDLEKKREQYNNEQQKLEPSYKSYQEKGNLFGKKQEELTKVEKKLEGIRQNMKNIEEQITKINAIQAKIKETQKKKKETQEKLEKNLILRKEIFHANGVPKFAIEKIIPAIGVRASEILSDLTDGRLNQISFTSLDGRRVGSEIEIFDGVRERDVSTFSGGEKTQINAAIRFAIMERIADIPDTTGAVFRRSDTLLIDEGDLGTLDDETSRQRFVDKILELKSRFKNIILITHLEDVAEQFPNRIKIDRDEYGKSRIFN